MNYIITRGYGSCDAIIPRGYGAVVKTVRPAGTMGSSLPGFSYAEDKVGIAGLDDDMLLPLVKIFLEEVDR